MKKYYALSIIFIFTTIVFVFIHLFRAPYTVLNQELNKITPAQSMVLSNTSDGQIFAGCPCMKRYLTSTEDISQLTNEFVTSLTNAGYVVSNSPTSYGTPSRRSMSCGGSNLSSEAEDKTIGLCVLVAETAVNRTGLYHRAQINIRFKKSLSDPLLRNDAALTPGENESSSYLDSTTKYVASSVTIDIRNK